GSRDGRAPDVDAECVAHGFGPAFTVLAPQLPDERMPDRNRWARRGRTLPVAGGAGAVTGRVLGCLPVVGPVRAVVQRVSRARVTVNGGEVGAIGAGLCVLVGVTHDDGSDEARRLAEKVWRLRIFDDDAGVMNRSVADVGGEVLVVSQFTLYGDTTRGRRPSWVAAARPDHA